MTKEKIIEELENLAKNCEPTTVRSFLNLIIQILKMSDRRIEGFIVLISGFSDIPVHGRSSESLGIHKRKNRKKVNS